MTDELYKPTAIEREAHQTLCEEVSRAYWKECLELSRDFERAQAVLYYLESHPWDPSGGIYTLQPHDLNHTLDIPMGCVNKHYGRAGRYTTLQTWLRAALASWNGLKRTRMFVYSEGVLSSSDPTGTLRLCAEKILPPNTVQYLRENEFAYVAIPPLTRPKPKETPQEVTNV